MRLAMPLSMSVQAFNPAITAPMFRASQAGDDLGDDGAGLLLVELLREELFGDACLEVLLPARSAAP